MPSRWSTCSARLDKVLYLREGAEEIPVVLQLLRLYRNVCPLRPVACSRAALGIHDRGGAPAFMSSEVPDSTLEKKFKTVGTTEHDGMAFGRLLRRFAGEMIPSTREPL